MTAPTSPGGGVPAPARVVASHALAAIAMSLPWPMLADLVWRDTHDDTLLGLTGAARLAPYVLLSWAVARIADRVCRTTAIRLTLLGRFALLAGAALAVRSGLLTGAVVFATLAVAAGTLAYPAAAAGMPGLARGANDRWTEALVTAEIGSFVVGPAVGGVVLGKVSPVAVFAVAAGLTGLAMVFLRGVSMPAPTRRGGRQAGLARILMSSAGAAPAIGVVVVLNAALAGLALILLPLAEVGWRDVDAFGPATAALGLGALVAPIVGHVLKVRSCAGGMVWFTSGVLVVAWSAGVVVAAPALVVAGAVAVRIEALATEQIQASVPDGLRAAALGFADTAMVGAAMVAAALAPHVTSATGARLHTVVVAAGVAAGGVVLVVTRRRGRPARHGAPADAAASTRAVERGRPRESGSAYV